MNHTAKAAFHFIPSLHAYHGSDLKHSSKGTIGINVIVTEGKESKWRGCFNKLPGLSEKRQAGQTQEQHP